MQLLVRDQGLLAGLRVRDYKSLCAAVTICESDTLVDTHTHTHTWAAFDKHFDQLTRTNKTNLSKFGWCGYVTELQQSLLKSNCALFTTRAYASAVLGVVILPVCPSVRLSVCLSVTRVHCDKTKWRTAAISIPHERAITLLLWYQEWLVGDAPFPLKSALKVTHPPSKNADFDRFPLITSQP